MSRKPASLRMNPVQLYNRLQVMGGLLLIDTRTYQATENKGGDSGENTAKNTAKNTAENTAENTVENTEATENTVENTATAEKSAENDTKHDASEQTQTAESEIHIIRSSIHVPSMLFASSCTLSQKLDLISQSLSENDTALFNRRKLKEIVCYSDEGSHLWMCELRDILVEEAEVFSVAIVDAPFSLFKQMYPFMCAPLNGVSAGSIGMYKIYPNEIETGLYLGNRRQAMDEEIMLNHLDFTHVVDLHDADIPAAFTFQEQGIKYFTLAIWDNDQAVFGKAFEQIFEFVENARSAAEHTQQGRTKKTKILFHCNQGISRSASCMIYYMMRKHKISLLGAFTAVQNARDCASPNHAFARQLLLEEHRLYGKQSDLTILSYPQGLGASPRGSCVIG